MAPNLPDPYHTLGLLHEAVGDTKKVCQAAVQLVVVGAAGRCGAWARAASHSRGRRPSRSGGLNSSTNP